MKSLSELATDYTARVEAVRELELLLKAAKGKRDEVEEALVDKMAEESTTSIKVQLDGGGTSLVVGSTKLFVSTKAGMSEQLVGAMKACGHGSLAKETVHASTLGAWAREQLKENGKLPEEVEPFVNTFTKLKLSARIDNAGQDSETRRITRKMADVEITDDDVDALIDEALAAEDQ